MPEYLSPGVYVEEVSFRSKSIEGVATSTTGFAGMTRTGPVWYDEGPRANEPRLITSFVEFERVYGGLEPMDVEGVAEPRVPYLAHAARMFFLNGGQRLYVARVHAPRSDGTLGVASKAIAVGGKTAIWRARWPGEFGNVFVETLPVRGGNVAFADAEFGGAIQAKRARAGSLVEVLPAGSTPPPEGTALTLANLRVVEVAPDGRQSFRGQGGIVAPAAGELILPIELIVRVVVDAERDDAYENLSTGPALTRYVGKILQRDDPEDEDAVVWLDWDPDTGGAAPFEPADLAFALTQNPGRLIDGHDGALPIPDDLLGQESDPDDAAVKATGLRALGEVEDIAIVALPDAGAYEDTDMAFVAAQHLIAHAEDLKYRIAVVDGQRGSSLNEIRAFRGRFDSKYAALYHPWVEIFNPLERPALGAPPSRLMLPPSGFVTGIYARTDVERGVYKAPANEIVRGLTRFEVNINKRRQDVLNPEGINALRFFEGRGNRVWGARTISSDPEWKYVNVRRLFIFLEHSIDRASQYAVFEPNNELLWARIRQSVEDFLYVQWKGGALLGTKPEEAFFVRCDRTTMTQNDIDNGRLIVLIGVAPTKPAEFVIFRIGQFTADSKVA